MPTKDQIRNLEIAIHKNHFFIGTKGRHRVLHDWKRLSVEDQQVLFCPTCSERLTRIFGGHFLYVKSARGTQLQIEREAVKRLMAEGKTSDEISEQLSIPKIKIFSITRKIAKKGVRNVRI